MKISSLTNIKYIIENLLKGIGVQNNGAVGKTTIELVQEV